MADSSSLLGHIDAAATRTMEELFRSAVGRIRTRLVNRIGSEMPVEVSTPEWSQLGTVMSQFHAGMAVATFRIDPSGLVGLVSIEPELLTRLVGQILGQPPDLAWAAKADRLPSRFDLVIARRIAEDVLHGITEIMPSGVGKHAVIEQVGAASRAAPGMPRTSLVCAVNYEVTTASDAQGHITVVVPSEITRLTGPQRPPRSPADLGRGIERVMPLPVTVVAELRRLSLSLRQIRTLQIGQVLDLGPSRDVVIRVGDRPALFGEAGVQNTLRSVRVKGRIEDGGPR